MKSVKRVITLLLAAIIIASLLLCVPVLADVPYGCDEIPEGMMQYVEKKAGFLKGLMRDENAGYIGTVFNSAAEIDSLKIGRGYRVFDAELRAPDKKISETLKESSTMLIAFENETGPAVFMIVTDDGGTYSSSGPVMACNLNEAISAMQSVANKSGINTSPYVVPGADDRDFYIMLPFNGDMRVVYAPSPCYEFNADYHKVKNYKELPTEDALKAEIERAFEPFKDLTETVYGNSMKLELNPQLEQRSFPLALIMATAVFVIVAILLGIVIYSRKRAKD